MSEDPLYRKALLRLAADAAGAGHLAAPDGVATAHNPACGDRVTVEVALTAGHITALAHDTQACILTQASAALLSELAPGRDGAGLEALVGDLKAMLAGGPALPAYAAFDGMSVHAGRQTCVLLPLQAALSAVQQAEESR